MALPQFLTWAVEANYPAGANPWNGQATKIQPVGDIFTPNTAIAAEELNYLFNKAFAGTQTVVTAGLNTWTNPQGTGTISATHSTTLDVLAWDDFNKWWVAIAHSSTEITISEDDGQNWNDIGAFATIPTGGYLAIGPHPTGSGVSLVNGGASPHIVWCTFQGAITDTGAFAGITNGGGAVAFPHSASSKVVGVIWDATNKNAGAYDTNGTADGTAVTSLTSSLPSSWTTANSLTSSYFTSAAGPSNDQVVAFGGTTPSTNVSRMLHVTWTGSAFVFTDLTLPAAVSGKSIVGITYNASEGLWGVAGWDGTNTTLYTSPDLVAWTAQAIIANQAGGLVSVGPYWVTMIRVSLAGTAYWRAFQSIDANAFFPLGSTPTSVLQSLPKTAQAPGGVATWTTSGAQISRRIG